MYTYDHLPKAGMKIIPTQILLCKRIEITGVWGKRSV